MTSNSTEETAAVMPKTCVDTRLYIRQLLLVPAKQTSLSQIPFTLGYICWTCRACELLTIPGRTPRAYTRCLTPWMSSASVAATSLPMMDALYGFVSQPPGLQPDSPGNTEGLAHTQTHIGGSFSLVLTECHWAVRCDRRGHSTAQGQWLTEENSSCFPSCCGRGMLRFSLKSNKNSSKPPGWIPVCGDHPLVQKGSESVAQRAAFGT